MSLELILIWAGAAAMIVSTILNFILNFSKNPGNKPMRMVAVTFTALLIVLYVYPTWKAYQNSDLIVGGTCTAVMLLALVDIIIMWLMGDKLEVLQKQEEEELKAKDKAADDEANKILGTVSTSASNSNTPITNSIDSSLYSGTGDHGLSSLVKTDSSIGSPRVPDEDNACKPETSESKDVSNDKTADSQETVTLSVPEPAVPDDKNNADVKSKTNADDATTVVLDKSNEETIALNPFRPHNDDKTGNKNDGEATIVLNKQ